MSTDTSFLNRTPDTKLEMTSKNGKLASCVKGIGVPMVAILAVICVSAVTAVVTVYLFQTNKPGENGEKGTEGNKGTPGDLGSKGEKGQMGEKGLLYTKGQLGVNGPKGIKGSIGEKGQRGDKGPIGDKGQRGDKGTAGIKGENGKFGDKGSVGDKGTIGDKGQIGYMGLPGVQGQTGEPGHKGANGEKGLKGSSGESGNVPVIVFRARNVSPDSDLSGTVIRFSNVDINSGSGYDKSTGKFTAPQAGTYLFILQICPEDNHSVLMTLRANNDKFGILNQKNNHDDGPCTSTSAITVLSEGEEVWVYCESASSGDSVWNANENGNSFSGVLIHTGTV